MRRAPAAADDRAMSMRLVLLGATALAGLAACGDDDDDEDATRDAGPGQDAGGGGDGGPGEDGGADDPDASVPTSAIPDDRLVPWRGNVGVEGGIPTRDDVRDCVAMDGVPTNGSTDATDAIQQCLDQAPVDGVAYLVAGAYRITGTLRVPGHKTLRGAGPTDQGTTIFTESELDSLVFLGAGYSDNGPLLPITSGATRGSTALELADASSLEAGDLVLLNELNDASIPVTPASYAEGDCGWCDQFGATRLRAQVARVQSRSGNTIEIAPPFFYDFSAGNEPSAMRLAEVAERSGVEDLVVRNDPGIADSWNVNIMVMGAANCWVKNVKVDTCGKRCIDLRTYHYRVEIRDSLIEGCLDHESSDTCYGTEVAEGSSSLIENNVYHDVSNGPILMWGASGNVVAYNYTVAVFRTQQRDSWFWPTSWTHGAHPSYNLWEGNDLTGINWDGYWGSASHNIAFRNRVTSHEPEAGLVPGHVEVAAIIIETNNHYMSVVGNVLGEAGWSDGYEEISTRYWSGNLVFATGTGGDGDPACFSTLFRHHNYDHVTGTTRHCGDDGEPECQGGDGSTVLPASLYLPGRPGWFGDAPFPPFDPEGPVVEDIPAKRRFAGR